MKLSRKVAQNTALGFSCYFALVNLIIFLSFSRFRKDEFLSRLQSKALTIGNLLPERENLENRMLQILERNHDKKLISEVAVVLDESGSVEYASGEIPKQLWEDHDIDIIKESGSLEKKIGKYDLFGMTYKLNGRNLIILVAGEDRYGYSKLQFIGFALSISFLTSLLAVWVVNRFFIQKQMKPLENFEEQIRTFSFSPAVKFLPVHSEIDEIRELTKSYNNLLSKVMEAFQTQREFNSNASHELKTPITRIAFQIEGLMNNPSLPKEVRVVTRKIHSEIHQLSDLVNSLLLLSMIDHEVTDQQEFPERIDDMIFEAYDSVHRDFPDFEMSFAIRMLHEDSENNLELKCLRPLMVSGFRNLLKNACIYSKRKSAHLDIEVIDSSLLRVLVYNDGKLIQEEEIDKLFSPFVRGKNAKDVQGYGLGLRMTKRIFDKYGCKLSYTVQENKNCFIVEIRN